MARPFLAWLVLLVSAALVGCAGLLIHPEESSGSKATKIGGRIGLAALSLGFSEVTYYCARHREFPQPGSPAALSSCLEESASGGSSGPSSFTNMQPIQWELQQSQEQLESRGGEIRAIQRETQRIQRETQRIRNSTPRSRRRRGC